MRAASGVSVVVTTTAGGSPDGRRRRPGRSPRSPASSWSRRLDCRCCSPTTSRRRRSPSPPGGPGRTRRWRRCSPRDRTAAWSRSAQRRPIDEWAARCARSRHRRRDAGRRRVPRRAGHATRSRLPCCSGAATGRRWTARRVGIVGTRNATGPGRQFAAALGFGLAANAVTVVSGLAKGIDGAAHLGALRADSASRRRCRRQRSRHPVSACRRRAVERRGDRRAAVVRVAAGHRAGAVPLPPTQPHPRRAQRARRRRRESRARWFADDGEGGTGAVDRGHGRSRVGQQPSRGGNQPADPRRGDAGHRRRRRAVGARARPPSRRAVATTPVRCRGARRPPCWSAAVPIRARSTTSSPTSACRSRRRR